MAASLNSAVASFTIGMRAGLLMLLATQKSSTDLAGLDERSTVPMDLRMLARSTEMPEGAAPLVWAGAVACAPGLGIVATGAGPRAAPPSHANLA